MCIQVCTQQGGGRVEVLWVVWGQRARGPWTTATGECRCTPATRSCVLAHTPAHTCTCTHVPIHAHTRANPLALPAQRTSPTPLSPPTNPSARPLQAVHLAVRGWGRDLEGRGRGRLHLRVRGLWWPAHHGQAPGLLRHAHRCVAPAPAWSRQQYPGASGAPKVCGTSACVVVPAAPGRLWHAHRRTKVTDLSGMQAIQNLFGAGS